MPRLRTHLPSCPNPGKGNQMKTLTADEIEAAKTPKGGWTRKQFAAWGIEWPPPAGWKDKLMGIEIDRTPLPISPTARIIPSVKELLERYGD